MPASTVPGPDSTGSPEGVLIQASLQEVRELSQALDLLWAQIQHPSGQVLPGTRAVLLTQVLRQAARTFVRIAAHLDAAADHVGDEAREKEARPKPKVYEDPRQSWASGGPKP